MTFFEKLFKNFQEKIKTFYLLYLFNIPTFIYISIGFILRILMFEREIVRLYQPKIQKDI